MDDSVMEKSYKPAVFEDRIYKFWTDERVFEPSDNTDKEPFVMVIPPPNVTGVLHMGHGLNNSLQDILARYHRMQGRPTLWLPGTDHAGIATQNVVERRLNAKGLSSKDLGREKFVEETWKVKEEHHDYIVKQLKKMGCSCDWSRERFTLDEGLSKAVREVFVTLFEKDLIYKGEYLVNWCPSCGTALADDEVDHSEEPGILYHIKYPLEEGGFLEIATTRPETMFGDTAVAVHPEDDRYKKLVGKNILLPLTDKKIPIIADTMVEIGFGTGAVKITPAHDPNDWEAGKRHKLDVVNILTPEALLNHNVPKIYQGMDVKTARKKVKADLDAAGLLIKEEPQPHQVGHCYRCKTIIEPFLSDQWYVKMEPLAKKGLDAWKDEEIHFYPKKWENTYSHWMNNIRDWCISRQLWWGHRIPVWYCNDCGKMMVLREDPTKCSHCGSTNLSQDPDVLDTWFSSWLWPFSTLGWPDKTIDLDRFFPTTALVTGYDIIFFWVARMVMAGKEFMGKSPFKDIYMTPLVRDKQGRKMSKSLGNGIDPLDIITEYGADSLKFTIAFLASQGEDLPLGVDTFKLGSKFCNKVWNASRYILMNLEGRKILPLEQLKLNSADQWIYHKLNQTVLGVAKAMENYRFDDMAHAVFEYFWNDLCDWYVEASKISLYSDSDDEKDRAASVLVDIMDQSLRLLHPFLSFITEEIYQQLPGHERCLAVAAYPQYIDANHNPQLESSFKSLQELVQIIRTTRSEFAIPPTKKIKVKIKCDDNFTAIDFFEKEKALIAMLVKSDDLEIATADDDKTGSISAAGKGFEVWVYIRDFIDIEKELSRLRKNLTTAQKLLKSTEGKFQNESFVSRAPAEIIEKEKSKLAEFEGTIAKMTGYLKELEA